MKMYKYAFPPRGHFPLTFVSQTVTHSHNQLRVKPFRKIWCK